MKTIIASNGKEVDITLTPDNVFEETMIKHINEFASDITINVDEKGDLVIHINSKPK